MQNMRVTSIATLLICATSSVLAAQAADEKSYFNGPYIRAGIGEVHHQYRLLQNDSIQIPNATVTLSFAINDKGIADSLTGHLAIGYSKVVNEKAYLAFEALSGISYLKYVGYTNLIVDSQGTLSKLNLNTTLKSNRNNWAFLGKIGILTTPQTAVYGIIGTEITRFKILPQFNTDIGFVPVDFALIQNARSATRAGIALGAGMQSYLSDNVSYGVEFLHTMYRSIDLSLVKVSVPEQTLSSKGRFKARSSSVMVNLAYHW